jgi:phage terminase Nu1 subunit (DNA packaging protein)
LANRGAADVELARLNQQQVAYLLGVTSRTVRDWADAPRNADGSYDARAVVAWFAAKSGSATSGDENYPTQRERLAAAQAEKVEVENRVRRGELVEVEQVGAEWDDLVLAARAKLLSMPTKVAPQLVGRTDPNAIRTIIRDEVHAALAELAGPVEPDADPVAAAA